MAVLVNLTDNELTYQRNGQLRTLQPGENDVDVFDVRYASAQLGDRVAQVFPDTVKAPEPELAPDTVDLEPETPAEPVPPVTPEPEPPAPVEPAAPVEDVIEPAPVTEEPPPAVTPVEAEAPQTDLFDRG